MQKGGGCVVEAAEAVLSWASIGSEARFTGSFHHLSHTLGPEAAEHSRASWLVDVGIALHHPLPDPLGDDFLVDRGLEAVAVEELSQLVLVLVDVSLVVDDGVEIEQTVASPRYSLARVERRGGGAVADLVDAPRVLEILVDLGDVRPFLGLVLEDSSEVSQ